MADRLHAGRGVEALRHIRQEDGDDGGDAEPFAGVEVQADDQRLGDAVEHGGEGDDRAGSLPGRREAFGAFAVACAGAVEVEAARRRTGPRRPCSRSRRGRSRHGRKLRREVRKRRPRAAGRWRRPSPAAMRRADGRANQAIRAPRKAALPAMRPHPKRRARASPGVHGDVCGRWCHGAPSAIPDRRIGNRDDVTGRRDRTAPLAEPRPAPGRGRRSTSCCCTIPGC